MPKTRKAYVCSNCGQESAKWVGKCPACGQWNTFQEITIAPETRVSAASARVSEALPGGERRAKPIVLSQVSAHEEPRIDVCDSELNRVLGGGLVRGSLTLLGGEPGIGKSTLLLQTCLRMQQERILYVSGEESEHQIKLRADRIGTEAGHCVLFCETELERIFAELKNVKPDVVVIDSIQTIYTSTLDSAPGSLTQVRECAAALTQFAKKTGIAVFMVGHVTKDGTLAGPKILEHCVDCSVILEAGTDMRYRTLRCQKNRFGAVNEIGVFAMTDSGMKEVKNPSAIFLNRADTVAPGSLAMVTWEGTRPLLVELQALVDVSLYGNPRRLSLGTDSGRLSMLLSVLHRHAEFSLSDQDVFVNVVGGVKIEDTSSDVPLCLALISSYKSKPIDKGTIAFGEIGLTGEVRPVPYGQERISEAVKQGFVRIIVPKDNAPRTRFDNNVEIIPVSRVTDLFSLL